MGEYSASVACVTSMEGRVSLWKGRWRAKMQEKKKWVEAAWGSLQERRRKQHRENKRKGDEWDLGREGVGGGGGEKGRRHHGTLWLRLE